MLSTSGLAHTQGLGRGHELQPTGPSATYLAFRPPRSTSQAPTPLQVARSLPMLWQACGEMAT